jgi:AcrR family transcriptional regulator
VTTAIPSRRERLRAATVDEIKQAARKLLVTEGPAAVSLRAIARDMGMTAAALYRYFPSLEALFGGLCTDYFDEVRQHLEAVRDAMDPSDPAAQLYEVCREFRRWSVGHPAEFALMFGSPLPGMEQAASGDPKHAAGVRFANVFGQLFAAVWQSRGFAVPAEEEIPAELRAQLEEYLAQTGVPIPIGAAQLFLSCWIRLYGLVALEVFGHLHFALSDAEPMFETELASLAKELGIEPRPLR